MSKNCPQKGLADLLIIITTAIVLATIPLASQLVQTRQDLGKSAQESCGTCKVFVSQTCYFDGGQTCEVCPQICTGCISGDDYGCLEWREYECGTYECNCTAEQIPYECGSCQDDPNCQSEETPTEEETIPPATQESESIEKPVPEVTSGPEPEISEAPDCLGNCLSTSGSVDECNSLCNGSPYPTSIPQPTVDPREACDSACWTACEYSESRWQCPSVDPRASCNSSCWTACDYSEGIWQCPPSPRTSCDVSCWTSCDYSENIWQCPPKPQPTTIPTVTPLTVTYTPTVTTLTPEIGATTPAGATTVSYDTTGEIGIKEPWTEEKTQEALIVGGLVVGVPAVVVGGLTAPIWAPAVVAAGGSALTTAGPTLTTAGSVATEMAYYGSAAGFGVVGGSTVYENVILDPLANSLGYSPEERAIAMSNAQTANTGGQILLFTSAAGADLSQVIYGAGAANTSTRNYQPTQTEAPQYQTWEEMAQQQIALLEARGVIIIPQRQGLTKPLGQTVIDQKTVDRMVTRLEEQGVLITRNPTGLTCCGFTEEGQLRINLSPNQAGSYSVFHEAVHAAQYRQALRAGFTPEEITQIAYSGETRALDELAASSKVLRSNAYLGSQPVETMGDIINIQVYEGEILKTGGTLPGNYLQIGNSIIKLHNQSQ